ncbi:LysM peptidoglycan-binding domain-containing protein [Paenibacillus durus]|uniref:LysM peptidoglycan-binding domain-containing protein n=1 Tax=Paenibacillus durus TaxID=44251 RepID=UPI001E57E28D
MSKKYGVPLDKVIEANPQIANPDVLAVGDKVKIPSVAVPAPDGSELYHKHTVKQGDTLWKLSKAWGIQLKDMIGANPQLKNPDVLKIGDIVNIPKKATVSPVLPVNPANPVNPNLAQPEYAPTAVSEKITPGGKAFTGPIEKAAETAPVAPTPVPVPEPVKKAETAPVAPTPVPVPEPAKKAETAPIVPAPIPVQQPANIPAPVAPVKKTIHTETQNLFVQISVPPQETAAPLPPMPEPVKEYHIPAPPKSYYACEPIAPCDKSYGYPGITENPNYYDCPSNYPMYENVQPISYAPYEAQPMAYMPEMPAPYCYPDTGYPVANVPAPYYPGVMPGYTAEMPANDFQPYSENPAYISPQYGIQPTTLPWPSCGCGGAPGIEPYPFGNEAPVYGNMPVYTSETQSFPYGMGIPQPYMAPSYPPVPAPGPTPYGSPVNIPPVPKFPGTEDWVYSNRLPVDTEVSSVSGASSEQNAAAANLTAEQNTANQGEVKSASTAKAKTSSRQGKDVKTSSTTKQQRSGKVKETVKKRRNPWISD